MKDNRTTNPAPQQLTAAEKVAAGAGSGAGKVTFNPFSIKK